MGGTVTASDDNANDNDVVIGVATFDTIDKEDVGETVPADDDNADDHDVVISVATLETTDAGEVG